MKTLDETRTSLVAGQFEFSQHAFKRAVERNISDTEIRQAGANATAIENYPEDKYAPSALLLGFTNAKRPLHVQVSLADSELTKIITLYEPDESEWTDNYSKRK